MEVRTTRIIQLVPTFGRFLLVGISGTLVNLGVLWLLVNLKAPQIIAALVAIELSIINNFIWNDCWTFKFSPSPLRGERVGVRGENFSFDTRPQTKTLRSSKYNLGLAGRFMRYQLVTSFTAAFTLGLFVIFSQVLSLHYLVAQSLAIGLSTLLNFAVNCWLTWQL